MTITALRLAALLIAVIAVFDPAIRSSRSSRPMVSIVMNDPTRDRALADRVASDLDRDFAVVRGPLDAASGTVIVGDGVPDDAVTLSSPVFAVTPARVVPSVRLLAVEAPATSPMNARIPVAVRAVVTGARGRQLGLQLRAGGVLADQRRQLVDSDSFSLRLTFGLVPVAVGALPLSAIATIEGTSIADSMASVVESRDARDSVLFFDPRPSWASSFVRRAVERDTRFVVASRVVTSRGVSNTEGTAPASLRDAESLGRYATIVVGSPEELTAADASALDGFMRGRGGRVVLLMDRRATGAVDRLTGVATWHAVRLPAATAFADSSGYGALRSQEIAWPSLLPPASTIHAANIARDSLIRAIVWSIPVGAGRLLVSGALDAWHYRDPATSAFDAFWTSTIAELSAGAPQPLEVSFGRPVLAPGDEGSVRVLVREAALARNAASSVEVSATLTSGTESTMVRLWPEAQPGVFAGTFTAPTAAGPYRLVVSSGAARTERSLLVDAAARPSSRDDHAFVAAFASSRGGFAVAESNLRELPVQLAAAFQAVSRVETWHPMRSAWWIMPFAILLGAEWWWRRRRGLA